MSTLKLSLLQQPLVWMDGEANLRFFDTLIAELHGRDMIVLPEMFTTGFAMEAAQRSLPEARVIDWLHEKAQATDALVGGSAAIHTDKGAVNRFLLVEPEGTVHRYDKRHLFRMADEHHHYLAGDRREVFTWRGWRILPQVCYDLRFPVFSRNHNDYDLALYVANWPEPRAGHWQALLLARAIENQAYIAGCNRVAATVTSINTVATAGLSAHWEKSWPQANLINPRSSMRNCRWIACVNIANASRHGAMRIRSVCDQTGFPLRCEEGSHTEGGSPVTRRNLVAITV